MNFRKFRNIVTDPQELFLRIFWRTKTWWNDETYIKFLHRVYCHQKLDLENPKTFSEKCQWMKLYYHNPLLNTLVDKHEVKKYVADKIGTEYVVESYGVWDRFEDIDFDKLPNQFVLKCTHTSGYFAVCKDKKTFDKKAACKFLTKGLTHNYYYLLREWAYKDVKPRIIAEKYMDSLLKEDTLEYKLTCMNGEVKFVTICSGIAHGEYSDRHNDHFTKNWERLNWYARYTPTGKDFKKTPEIEKIIELSEILAKDLSQVRADWYIHNGKIYFGELTFYTWGGWPKFTPVEWDAKLGSWWKLPEKML